MLLLFKNIKKYFGGIAICIDCYILNNNYACFLIPNLSFMFFRSRSSREEKFQKNCLSLSKISVKQENLKYLP